MRIIILLYIFFNFTIAYGSDANDNYDYNGYGGTEVLKDPFEKVNRAIFGINRDLDNLILKPASHIYSTAMPNWGQARVRNALRNLEEPVYFFNDLIQGKIWDANQAVWRFFVNSVFGIFGLLDIAKYYGLEAKPNYFADSMAYYCFIGDTYVMLPILGPSSTSAGIGRGVDYITNPISYWLADHRRWVYKYTIQGVSDRTKIIGLEDLSRSSVDFYATVKSIYSQRYFERLNAVKQSSKLCNKRK
jgi:phospholipid-binding lipoprotein MlaA